MKNIMPNIDAATMGTMNSPKTGYALLDKNDGFIRINTGEKFEITALESAVREGKSCLFTWKRGNSPLKSVSNNNELSSLDTHSPVYFFYRKGHEKATQFSSMFYLPVPKNKLQAQKLKHFIIRWLGPLKYRKMPTHKGVCENEKYENAFFASIARRYLTNYCFLSVPEFLRDLLLKDADWSGVEVITLRAESVEKPMLINYECPICDSAFASYETESLQCPDCKKYFSA